MDTMIAYRLLNAQTQPEFQEVPEPHAAPGQVLVKVGLDFFKMPPGAQLVTSLNGGTVALKEIVDLAALGRIKSLVDRYPLSAVKQAYDDFEHKRLVGRAVVIPEGAEASTA
jgi:D-arabinose 1-dehydrogenase-like Zn-dependent alcohol dehydrogenase